MRYQLNIKEEPFEYDSEMDHLQEYSTLNDSFELSDLYEDEGIIFPEIDPALELPDTEFDELSLSEVGAQSAPKLLKSETQPIGQSLYVSIPLGSERPAKPMTGIFVPAGYKVKP